MDCDHCGRQIDQLPYTCGGCEGDFCVDHRLPEDHDCVALKADRAGQEYTREQGDGGPWFKEGFRLSNVDEQERDTTLDPGKHIPDREDTARGRRPDDPITPDETDEGDEADDRYRAANASEACTECETPLFEHEAAGCPHCGEIYCGDHLPAHRRTCDERDDDAESATTVAEHYQERTREKQQERTTRTDELEEERRKRYSSPEVNPDGTLSEPEYAADLESDDRHADDATTDTGSNRVLWATLLVGAVALAVFCLYLFVL